MAIILEEAMANRLRADHLNQLFRLRADPRLRDDIDILLGPVDLATARFSSNELVLVEMARLFVSGSAEEQAKFV